MRIFWFMEHLLAMEAEAKCLLTPSERSFERRVMEELKRILEEAEFLFGPRDRSFELREPLVSECFTANVIVYPFRFARIYLSSKAKTDPFVASYDLSHEAIHVLGPEYALAPTVLEEGLATYFSLRYMNRVYGLGWRKTFDAKYDAAMDAVSILLAKNEFLIKELRARQPVISKIDERLLVEVAGIESGLAKFLSADFQSYGQEASSWTERAADGAQLFANGFRSIWDQWKSA